MKRKLLLRNTILIAFSIIIFLSSCTPYTKEEKAAMFVYLAAAFADIDSTNKVLDNGGYEKNKLLGRHSNDGVLILSNIGGFLVLYLTGEIFKSHRIEIWLAAAALKGGVAYRNYRLADELKDNHR